ncbi:lytic transglycosylase domain-containing protein [Sulfitobacter sp. F26169L]|uniref:lytic transglycosylase domain-containing protein n=1 Tax=Sulfitobacter sp. F26169L TaxID=2996015 RepID=UPI0022609D69|nr:lytic transglycosylase domain-containing protein [Sulfitobacter sp. F26169L]MCX7566632.1 lytic transglycosylase domain-containing protein [Sulfitobacter sp. F26169L]
MQAMTRHLTALLLLCAMALPANAERPRPLGWGLDAMRSGDFTAAEKIAARDGEVARDVIIWHRLRAAVGSYDEIVDFIKRRPDWPGMDYLRRRSEPEVIKQNDEAIIAFFEETPAQTPLGVLAHAAALTAKGLTGTAQANLVIAWRTMPMNATSQEAFLDAHEALLKPHHDARLDAMVWQREYDEARQMYGLASKSAEQAAEARIAFYRRTGNAASIYDKLPASLKATGGVNHALFEWRIRKGRVGDAKDLLVEASKSFDTLGNPAAWGNRRRALARGEMRSGDPARAYAMASQHFLTEGSDYADLEWLAGYIALRFLDDPLRAHQHFLNHDSAVESPISQGRAGYWQGRALEAAGDNEGATAAYRMGANFQTSFYGLLAAERARIPFPDKLKGLPPAQDWRTSALAKAPLFEAGLLLQASGDLNLAERFWTHLAEQLMEPDLELLGQAAIDVGQPHIAVMIGKRAAQRGLEIAAPYYALHPAGEADLPMAPEMTLAIARRESEFDPVVQSHVGARGLMQLMPATALEVAQGLGIKAQHTTDRLTADPVYNARLGAQYLAELAGRFDGNVVMMAAGYNAGPSRPIRWMNDYGDPREGDIYIVDWVEMVPFRETQNYIMRVTESLPIYRARLGRDPLPISFYDELTGSTLKAFAPKGE